MGKEAGQPMTPTTPRPSSKADYPDSGRNGRNGRNGRFHFRKAGLADREVLIDYTGAEPAENLFIRGDLAAYGFNDEQLDLWIITPEDAGSGDSGDSGIISAILLRFDEHYIPYGRQDDFGGAAAVLAEFLRIRGAERISGKKVLMDCLGREMPELSMTDTWLARLDQVTEGWDPADVFRFRAEEAEIITDFYCGIEEFETRLHPERSLARTRESLRKEGSGRFYGIRVDGQVAAMAAASAEYTESAMIVGVATAVPFRGRGLASRVIAALCRDLLAEGKAYVCLFYFNPDAGRIYHRIGFKDIGLWVMGKRKTTAAEP